MVNALRGWEGVSARRLKRGWRECMAVKEQDTNSVQKES